MSALLLVLAVGFVVAVCVLLLIAMTPSPPQRAAIAFVQQHHLTPTADVERAVIRFLGRVRDAGRRGMVTGLLGAVVLGIAWYQQVTLGFGPSPLADLLTMGLGGWFVGLIVASRYSNPPRGGGVRAAALRPRDSTRYRSTTLARAMVGVGACSLALGLGALAFATGADRGAVIALAALEVAALLVAWRTQRRIVRRPQPFVTDELLAADDAIRAASAVVIGLAAVGLGLVVIGWQASFLARVPNHAVDGTWWTFLPMPCLIAGLVVAARARRVLHPKVLGPRVAATV